MENDKWWKEENYQIKKKSEHSEKKKNYKYLEILEADAIKQVEMKEKVKKEYLRRIRKLLKTKLYSRNLIKGINTWAIPPCKILGAILKVDEGRTYTNRPENKKSQEDA